MENFFFLLDEAKITDGELERTLRVSHQNTVMNVPGEW
jgi:hypothetical protein